MNLPVLLFSTGLAFVTAIVFGIWPAMQLSRPDLGRVAQASTRRVIGSAQGRRVHRVMIGGPDRPDAADADCGRRGGEGVPAAANADLGYDPQNTMSLPIPVHDGTYQSGRNGPNISSSSARIAAMPQVVAAGSRPTPRRLQTAETRVRDFRPPRERKPVARANFVSSDYFPLLRIPSQGPSLDRRRDRARRAPGGDQPDDGAAIFAEWRRDRPPVPVPDLKNEPPYRRRGRSGWLDRRSSAWSPTRETTACASLSSRHSTCPTR